MGGLHRGRMRRRWQLRARLGEQGGLGVPTESSAEAMAAVRGTWRGGRGGVGRRPGVALLGPP